MGQLLWAASPLGIGGLPHGPPPADDIMHSGVRHIEGVGYLANGFAEPMLSHDGVLDVSGQLFPRWHHVGSSPSNDSCMQPAVLAGPAVPFYGHSVLFQFPLHRIQGCKCQQHAVSSDFCIGGGG